MSEYAPKYTFKEGIRLRLLYVLYSMLVILFLWGIFGITKISYWLECSPYGRQVFFYGEFVGMYIFFGCVSLFFWIKNDYPVIKLKQYPLPHKKVLRKIKYKYGWRAVMPVVIKLIICISFFIISIWGYFQATIIINNNINVIEQQIWTVLCENMSQR